MPKSEVEEHDLAVRVDVQVSCVQVAVEQAVPQAALEDTEQQGFHQLGAVEAGLSDRGCVVDADALDAFHRQHPLGRQVPVHLRHPDVLAERRGVHMRHPRVHRLRFEPEVELFGQVVGEVGDDVLGGQPPAELGELDELRPALEDLQVGRDAPTDARPLDLDHDLFAAVQGRVVHLRDRGRCERLLLEGLEELGGVVAEFLLEQLVDFVLVGGRDRIEQAAKLAAHLFAERARAGRDDLAELDVGGPEVGERLRDLLDDLLLQRAFTGKLGDDPRARAGHLPTRRADAGSLDRQRHPVQLGHLAVFSRTHGCSVSNGGLTSKNCVDRVTRGFVRRSSPPAPQRRAATPVRAGRGPFRRRPRTVRPRLRGRPCVRCAVAPSGPPSRG